MLEIGADYHIYGLANAGTGVRTGFSFPKTASGIALCQAGDVKSDPTPKHREKQFENGFLQGPLSAEGMGIWESAWSEVKTT